MAIEREVEFVGSSLGSIDLADNGEAEYLGIKLLRPLIVGADDGYMVEGGEEHVKDIMWFGEDANHWDSVD